MKTTQFSRLSGALLAFCLLNVAIPQPVSSKGTAASLRQSPAPPPLTAETREQVANKLGDLLEKNYIFLDKAQEMIRAVRQNLQNKAYDSFTEQKSFAAQLTRDLHAVYPDKHLSVQYNPAMEKQLLSTITDPAEEEKFEEEFFSRLAPNYGFVKAEIMDGNVGYLDIRLFNPSQSTYPVARGAMSFVSNADALIIDLRKHHGGDPDIIKLLSSYFFDKPTLLNTFYERRKDSHSETWTDAEVQGKKMTGVDLYLLTSSKTFSGAEEFAYNLKMLKRATVIGETTGGGAHPVDFSAVGFGFVAGIPYARAINPISKTNWEGVGVEPDIKVPAEAALNVARKEALKKIIARTSDPNKRDALEKLLLSIGAN